MYPKLVKPSDVVNDIFGDNLFRIKGGRAFYDEVWMADGVYGVYLARVTPTDEGLRVTKRQISWDTELEQMYPITYKSMQPTPSAGSVIGPKGRG